MPQYHIILECQSNGIDSLRPCEDTVISFTVSCDQCGYRPEKDILIELAKLKTVVKPRSSKIDERHSWNCRDCKRQGSLNIFPIEGFVEGANFMNSFRVATAEIRGSLFLNRWNPNSTEFYGKRNASENSQEVSFHVELVDGAWIDYDEAAGQPVDISGAVGVICKIYFRSSPLLKMTYPLCLYL